MKKTYMTPDMEVVCIQINQMLCGSPNGSGSTPSGQDNPIEAEPGDY